MSPKMASDFLLGISLFVNASLFIPQAWRLFLTKDARGNSLITFGGFNFIQTVAMINGYYHENWAMVFGYLASLLTCGSVTLLTLWYRVKGQKI
jgi:MtN3 and saliva related transmembrane protein